MNESELLESNAALAAENAAVRAQLAATLEETRSARADLAAALHASETYRTGFEAQQAAHEASMKVVAQLKAQLKTDG